MSDVPPTHVAKDMARLLANSVAFPLSRWAEQVAGMNPADVRPDRLLSQITYDPTPAGYMMVVTFGFGVVEPEPHISKDASVDLVITRVYKPGSTTRFELWTAGTLAVKRAGDPTRRAYNLPRELLNTVVTKICLLILRPRFWTDDLAQDAAEKFDAMIRDVTAGLVEVPL
jgi:hypothetical protein